MAVLRTPEKNSSLDDAATKEKVLNLSGSTAEARSRPLSRKKQHQKDKKESKLTRPKSSSLPVWGSTQHLEQQRKSAEA